jgi:hypothetical protein
MSQSDPDKHSSEDGAAQSDIETDNGTDDVTDTNFTQWNCNTNCRLTVPVVHRPIGGPSGLRQKEAAHISKIFLH